ncbi:MAG: hypothetical protein Q8L52_03785 [bacterium]|nr:hypothetical protein [bacterium]
MSTALTCTDPKDAWALVSHFLGNLLQAIGLNSEIEGIADPDKRKNVIHSIHLKLIGSLYALVRSMNKCGQAEEAAKIQQVLDMVVEGDLTKIDVRNAIFDKHKELDPQVNLFKESLARLKAAQEAGNLTEQLAEELAAQHAAR